MQRLSATSSNSLNNRNINYGSSIIKSDNNTTTTKTVIRQKTSVSFIDRPNTSIRKPSRKNINARLI